MSKSQLTITVLLYMTFAAESCKPNSLLGCDITMTSKYIESSCGLINGVRFEQLEVISFDSTNSPEVYKVVSSFQCYNPGIDGKQEFWPDKLYFEKANGHYLWSSDTSTNGIYIRKGLWRDLIQTNGGSLDSIITSKKKALQKNKGYYYHRTGMADIKLGSQSYSICPAKLKSNTWYYLNFYDQRYEAYMYVDKDMKFRTNKIPLTTNI